MIFVLFSAEAPVKPVSAVHQHSSGKTSQSVPQRPTSVTSEQQKAEKSQEEPEVLKNDALYKKKFLKVSPRLKEENVSMGVNALRSAFVHVSALTSQQLEEELQEKTIAKGVAGTVSQELKDKLRKVGNWFPLKRQHGCVPGAVMKRLLLLRSSVRAAMDYRCTSSLLSTR